MNRTSPDYAEIW